VDSDVVARTASLSASSLSLARGVISYLKEDKVLIMRAALDSHVGKI